MRAKIQIDTRRLDNSIKHAVHKMGVDSNEAVKAAALFFTQSFAKAMKMSRKYRRVRQFDDITRIEHHDSWVTYHVTVRRESGDMQIYRRRKSDLRAYKEITYRGMGRQIIAEAARSIGLSAVAPGTIASAAQRDARQYAQGYMRQHVTKPYIKFTYYNRDLAGYPGRKAIDKAIPAASRRMYGFAQRVMQQNLAQFQRAQ